MVDSKNTEILSDYKLGVDNYYDVEYPKYQIVIGHTGRNTEIYGYPDMMYFNSWKTRRNNKFTENAMFSIDTFGTIYQHFDTKYYSDFIDENDINKNIISISLLNEGALMLDGLNSSYYTWDNKKYNRDDKVIYKIWRDQQYWSPYTEKQYGSLNFLLNKLCYELKINKKFIGHNTSVDSIENFEGITTRANYSFDYLDVSPAFDWKKISFE